MATLAQLLARHRCILVLDAASAVVQVGLLRSGQPAIWRKSDDESGKALFVLADACLAAANGLFSAVDAFVYCEGPGSMLGIRTAAMAIRTWQGVSSVPLPAYRYQSLRLIALDLVSKESPPFSVIADARRDSWHRVTVDARGVGALERVATADIAAASDPLFQPTGFRAWAPPPRAVHETPYDVAALLAAHDNAQLLQPTETPDAFQYEAPEYKKWTPQIHTRP